MIDPIGAPRDVRLSLLSGRGHYDAVIDAVIDAKVSVWIATANLKGLMVEDTNLVPGRRRSRRSRYRPVLAVLAELAERGVELRILHAGFPSRAFREEFDRQPVLVAGGLELRQCGRVHLKTVVVDGQLLYLGSANWTGAGLGVRGETRRNFELGVLTRDEAMLDDVQAMFAHLWRGAECGGCGLRELCDAPLDVGS